MSTRLPEDAEGTAEPVAIVGAGIAGLTAALAFARAGTAVVLHERAPRIEPVGAGIQLSANALRVLDRLGVLEALRPKGVAARSVALRSAFGGRVLAEVPVTSADGVGYLAIHRADLQECLLNAVRAAPLVRLRLASEFERAVPTTGGVRLSFREGSGETRHESAALVVGADGVRSAVAASLGLPPHCDTGLVATRLRAVNEAARPFERIEAWLGPRRHAVAYPMEGGRSVNVVLIGPADDLAGTLRGYARWDSGLRALLDRSEAVGTWPLLTSEAKRNLVQGPNTVLIGDAAHAVLPFAAQGAAMAIEDAYVLAGRLAGVKSTEVAHSLQLFQAQRQERLGRVRARVRFHHFVYHLPRPFSFGRDAALALRAPNSLRNDLAWLYDWRP